MKSIPKRIEGIILRICFKNLEPCPFSIKQRANVAFVFIPFSGKFQDIYTNGIKKILEDSGWTCQRADEKFDTPEVICTICKSIQESNLIIADLTGRNPNVFLEIGLAFGLEKHVILLSQNSNDIPFDARTFRTLIYNPIELEDLKNRIQTLVESIKTPLKTSGTTTFEMKYNKMKRIRGISTGPLIEIFIGSERETTEWLPINKENLNLMQALPDVFDNESVEPRREYFEFLSRSPKISATMDSNGFFHAVIPLRCNPHTKKYYLDSIVHDIGEALFFTLRAMKKKAIKTEQHLKIDLQGIRGLEIALSSSPLLITHKRSFSKEQDDLSYEKTFDPKEKWAYFFNLMCETYKDIITDLGIIDISVKTVKQNVRNIMRQMDYLRTAYQPAGLEIVPLNELFGDADS